MLDAQTCKVRKDADSLPMFAQYKPTSYAMYGGSVVIALKDLLIVKSIDIGK